MGTSSTSQKRKNTSKSWAQKTPMMLEIIMSSHAKYSLTLTLIFHEARTAMKPRKEVNITRGMLRPSTPRKNWMSYDSVRLNHVCCVTKRRPVSASTSKLFQPTNKQTAMMKDRRVKPAAVSFTVRSGKCLNRAMSSAPKAGKKSTSKRRIDSSTILHQLQSFFRLLLKLPQSSARHNPYITPYLCEYVETREDHQHTQDYGQAIHLKLP